MLDFNATQDKLNNMLEYHKASIAKLATIDDDSLTGQVIYLSDSINRTIIEPIERTLIICSIIEKIGIENMPDKMVEEWLENIEFISTQTGFEV